MKDKDNLAKRPEANLAIPMEELDEMFGGPGQAVPIEINWPEIKLTKTSDFILSDETTTQELVGHIIFAQRSRAYWVEGYGVGDDKHPACQSSDTLKPDAWKNDNPQSERCGENICKRATWYKDENGKNKVDCKVSLNMLFLPEEKSVPRFIRIRSNCMRTTSSLAKFFAFCFDGDYALGKKFQTVQVSMKLAKTTLNGFDTSTLTVNKLRTLTTDDPLLPELGKLFDAAKKDFVVVHQQDSNEAAEPEPAQDGGDGDDIPL